MKKIEWRNQKYQASRLVVVTVFATIGSALLLASHAATPTASIEPKNSTVATASVVTDSTASNSKAVKFQVASTGGNSCPAYPSFPDANCTGVPAGTTLTVKNGNQTITTAGTVVDGWDVNGKIIVKADNVTIKNSKVHGPAAGSCVNGAAIEFEGQHDTVQDTTVVMDHPTACLDGIWLSNNYGTALRVNVGGGTDGIKACDSPGFHDCLVQDSYIHDMKWFASDPNQSGGTDSTHNDGVQDWSGAYNITLRHNRIDLSTVFDSGGNLASNAAWQSGASNARVEYNYLDGGGCTLNFASGSSSPTNKQQPIYINNNHFGRIRGYSGCVVLINNNAVMTEYTGNVYDDNGQAVPTWQQHN